MVELPGDAAWWRMDLRRGFTKLECGLLGALFMGIAIIFALLMRLAVI
jgi:hypothetical protein